MVSVRGWIVVLQWKVFRYDINGNHILSGTGMLRMTIGRCRYLGSFLSKLLYPVVKGADSNAVLAAPVNICHATGPAFIDKFQLFFLETRDFLVFAMMLSSIIVVVVVK